MSSYLVLWFQFPKFCNDHVKLQHENLVLLRVGIAIKCPPRCLQLLVERAQQRDLHLVVVNRHVVFNRIKCTQHQVKDANRRTELQRKQSVMYAIGVSVAVTCVVTSTGYRR